LALLRDVFGDAHMQELATYEAQATAAGLVVDLSIDLTEDTRPTFDRWRENAARHREEVVRLLGEADHQKFVDACDVLDAFWRDGTLGYGLVAATKP
jgi:cyclopropane fatty-acyl-phospholipid synthase-like methyltransferase